jgi:hypothetical protein
LILPVRYAGGRKLQKIALPLCDEISLNLYPVFDEGIKLIWRIRINLFEKSYLMRSKTIMNYTFTH